MSPQYTNRFTLHHVCPAWQSGVLEAWGMRIYQRKWRDTAGRVRTSRYWSVEYVDWRGRRRRRALYGPTGLRTTSRRVATVLAAELDRREQRRRGGVDDFEDERLADPLELVEEFVLELERRGRDEHYRTQVARRLGELLAGVESLVELTPARIRRELGRVARERAPTLRRPQGGLSPRTQNAYRDHLKAFFGWLVREGRWDRNPVQAVATVSEDEPPERRTYDADELARLVHLSPLRRGALYLFAATTGARRAEIAQIREADVDLERGVWRGRGAIAKNRKGAVIPLAPWTVEVLGYYLAEVPPGARGNGYPARGERLFAAVPKGATLRADVHAAQIEDDGRRVTFHGLRMTLATWLAREGVPLTLAQRLMRHSNPALTSNVYTKFVLQDAREAVERLRPKLKVVEGGAA